MWFLRSAKEKKKTELGILDYRVLSSSSNRFNKVPNIFVSDQYLSVYMMVRLEAHMIHTVIWFITIASISIRKGIIQHNVNSSYTLNYEIYEGTFAQTQQL